MWFSFTWFIFTINFVSQPGPNTVIPESCDYFSASCDQQLDYCVLQCSGPALPFSLLARFDKANDKFVDVQVLENNSEQRAAVAELELPSVLNFTVPEDSG